MLTKSSFCLAINLDFQGNLTTELGVEVAEDQLTTYEVITERSPAKEVLIPTRSGLTLLPSDISLASAEPELMTKIGNFYLLKEVLEPIESQFDHILIDS